MPVGRPTIEDIAEWRPDSSVQPPSCSRMSRRSTRSLAQRGAPPSYCLAWSHRATSRRPDGSNGINQISGRASASITEPGDPRNQGGGRASTCSGSCGRPRGRYCLYLSNNVFDGHAKEVVSAAMARRRGAARGGDPRWQAARHWERDPARAPGSRVKTAAFVSGKVTIWMPDGEDMSAPQTQHKLDPSAYTLFAAGKLVRSRRGTHRSMTIRSGVTPAAARSTCWARTC